jgi:hypothetical protein
MAYQEKYRSGQALLATPEPGDDEIPIFDRVTFGLSRLPNIEGAKAFADAQTEVMCEVREQYGLSAAAVDAISVGSGTRSTVPRPDLPAR